MKEELIKGIEKGKQERRTSMEINKILTNIIIDEIQNIGDIERNGIIVSCNEMAIKELLLLHMLTKEDLIKLRNALVENLADRIDNWKDVITYRTSRGEEPLKTTYENIERLSAIMTAVTGIIDKEYVKRD